MATPKDTQYAEDLRDAIAEVNRILEKQPDTCTTRVRVGGADGAIVVQATVRRILL